MYAITSFCILTVCNKRRGLCPHAMHGLLIHRFYFVDEEFSCYLTVYAMLVYLPTWMLA